MRLCRGLFASLGTRFQALPPLGRMGKRLAEIREMPVEQRPLDFYVEALATCSRIRSQETVLLQGPPGVGKTHFAVALGVRAVECGFSVGFHHLDDLRHDLKQDAEVPPTRVKGKKYLRNALLIIEEVGFRHALINETEMLRERRQAFALYSGTDDVTSNILAGIATLAAAWYERIRGAGGGLDLCRAAVDA